MRTDEPDFVILASGGECKFPPEPADELAALSAGSDIAAALRTLSAWIEGAGPYPRARRARWDYVRSLLEQAVPMPAVSPGGPAVNQAAIDLLRSWREVSDEEAEEQRETGEYLIRALDEERGRIGARKLFELDAGPLELATNPR